MKMVNIGHNAGWMESQDDECEKSAAYEQAIDRADYLRDEIKDRQMEELWAKKERGEM